MPSFVQTSLTSLEHQTSIEQSIDLSSQLTKVNSKLSILDIRYDFVCMDVKVEHNNKIINIAYSWSKEVCLNS